MLLKLEIHFVSFVDKTFLQNSLSNSSWFLSKIIGSHFYHNILNNSQSQHRIVLFTKNFQRKSFAIKVFQFCDLKTEQRYKLQEEFSAKGNSVLWSTVCAIFSKLLMKRASSDNFNYENAKLRVDLQSETTIFLLITSTISSNKQKDKFIYRSDLETTFLASFPSTISNYSATKFFLQNLQTLTNSKLIISTRTDFMLQTSVKYKRTITMCSAFTPDFALDNSTINLIGDVYCPNTKCWGKLCLHKKTVASLGRSVYQCPQWSSVCQVSNIPFKGQTNSFFLSFGQRVHIFEESLKSIEDVFDFCLGRDCFNREKCESFDAFQTTRSYI